MRELLICCVFALTACDSPTEPTRLEDVAVWPPVPHDPSLLQRVLDARAAYPPNDHIRFLSDGYSSTGQYLNFWHQKWTESDVMRFDSTGIPQIRYGDTFYDHPITFGRRGVHLHGRIVLGEPELTDEFLYLVERLLARQDERGAFTFPFEYKLYGYKFEPGWPSGMAQGLALSVLRRAYSLNPDPRYIEAGNRAVEFLLIPRERGGVLTTMADLDPSLSGYIWIEEFATIPANYKLNGFMFALLGLYDWAGFGQRMSPTADRLFREGVRTLKRALPYYDVGGFTATDMRRIIVPGTQPNISTLYHRVHIYQLHTMAEITGSSLLKQYEMLWRSYVGDNGE